MRYGTRAALPSFRPPSRPLGTPAAGVPRRSDDEILMMMKPYSHGNDEIQQSPRAARGAAAEMQSWRYLLMMTARYGHKLTRWGLPRVDSCRSWAEIPG